MNILIVDDNKNNRMILQLLLEDYAEENGNLEFSIDEAEDGLIAVQKTKENSYDLIFMDIMMPNMDGIEATKQIHSSNPKIMIVAVSAVDDAQRQREILNSGAEDYVSKPVNADIFNSRLVNYLKLIESRNAKSSSKTSSRISSSNLYSDKVFAYNLTFFIDNDDSLSEFWEYYLFNDNEKSVNLNDVIRVNFSLCELILKVNKSTTITVEESEEKIFFTLDGIETLGKKIVDLVLLKNDAKLDYKSDEKHITFVVSKEENKTETLEDVIEQKVEPVVEEKTSEIVTSQQEFQKSSQELHIYNYMDIDDLDDMGIYVQKLNSLMLLVGGGSIEEDDVNEMSELLENIAKIMNIYTETYDLGQSIQVLAENMHSNISTFLDNAQDLGPLCSGFGRDISTWNQSVFHSGAPSYDYLDATIIANAQTISSVLNPQDSSADMSMDDLDDIFDF
jgi:CheY-like chemotaxis protein